MELRLQPLSTRLGTCQPVAQRHDFGSQAGPLLLSGDERILVRGVLAIEPSLLVKEAADSRFEFSAVRDIAPILLFQPVLAALRGHKLFMRARQFLSLGGDSQTLRIGKLSLQAILVIEPCVDRGRMA
ncbi:MAG: hypothetical protein ACK5QX_08160 [bacterium]